MNSVIIPAFNAEKTLSTCLVALMNQTLPPDEIIVVDDGSTDGTAGVANTYKVTLVRQTNQGPASARNAGIQAAHGEIVLFTDADCTPDSHWVERMVQPFCDSRIDSVKGAYRTRQTRSAARLVQCEFEERYELLKQFEYIDFVDTHAAAFRKKAVLEVGSFDPAFPEANNEDVDLSYRLAAAGKRMVFTPDACVYHQHPDNFLEYFRLKIKRGYWRMIVYKHHPGKAVKDTYTPQVLKLQILLIYLAAAALVFCLFNPLSLILVVGCVAFFLLTVRPFLRLVHKFAPDLALLSIWFIFIRAVAFSIGIIAGIGGMFLFHYQIAQQKEI
ncbi:MAG TPA: glycosyltransferase [Leptolinea sp.]